MSRPGEYATVFLLAVIALAVSLNAYTGIPADFSPKTLRQQERKTSQAAPQETPPASEVCVWIKVQNAENGNCALPDASHNLLTTVQTADGQVFEIDFRPADNKLRITVIQPGAHPTE